MPLPLRRKEKHRIWQESRTNSRVCMAQTVPVEKQRFRWCPEKKRQNRTKPRFIHMVHRREKAVLNGFSCGKLNSTVGKTVQRGTAPNRTVGLTISENHTEPHRGIAGFGKPQCDPKISDF